MRGRSVALRRRDPVRWATASLFAALIALSACAPTLPALQLPEPRGDYCCVRGEEPLTLEYLGVGGWLLRMGDAALLTAPFFSNPRLVEVGITRIGTDTARVDRFLPRVDDVPAVLVGHAHYDHLMDVPYILRRHAVSATLYGSRTAVNLVRGDQEIDPARLVEVESRAGDHRVTGEWVYVDGGRIRFMPLRSGHAPHLFGIHLYEGEEDEPRKTLPRRAGEWVEGTPLAYLIDFLTPGGEVAYRIHYQDAASNAPEGFPPAPEDGIPVDLAILCPPGFEQVEDYPEGILGALRPKVVLLGHWEDFFRPRNEPLRAVPSLNLTGFLERMAPAMAPGGRWALPEPGEVVTVSTGSGK